MSSTTNPNTYQRFAVRYHAGKFAAVVALVFVVALAAYNGYIALPGMTSVMTLVVGLVIVVGLVSAVFADSGAARLAALVVAFIAGGWLALNRATIPGLFGGFTAANTLGLVVAGAATLAVATWAARRF